MQYGKRLQTIAIITSVIVLGAIVVGLVVVGSPAKERAHKRDQQRISNLQEIENDIVIYWQAKKALPPGLADLNDATRGITIPTDPQTKSSYVFKTIDSLKFQLCATFEQDGKGTPNYRTSDDNWDYHVGQTCFDRTIDPAFYPTLDNSAIPTGKPIAPPVPVPGMTEPVR